MPSTSRFPFVATALRDGAWLNAERARAYPRILFSLAVMISIAWLASSPGGLDRQGNPIGADFVSFWTASQLALAGHPALAWSIPAHWAAQRSLVDAPLGYTAFFYPPPYLLICLPLALAPYLWSLAIWLAVTGYAYWLVVRRMFPRLEPIAFLGFPAVLINCAHGQNAFLAGAVFGAGLVAMDRKPALGGLILGLLAFKPQLVLLLPFSLCCARRWVTLAAATISALLVCAASYLAFGATAWASFFSDARIARLALEHHLIGDEKMQSVFAAVRLLGGSIELGYALQAIAAFGAISALFLLHKRELHSSAEPAAVVCACLLASPFLLDYDLALLAILLAWLTDQGLQSGFRPYEKTFVLCGYGLPLISRTVAGRFGLPLAPAVIGAILLCILSRVFWSEAGPTSRFMGESEDAATSGLRGAAPSP